MSAGSQTIDVRHTQPDEYRLASNTVAAALLYTAMDDDEWAQSRPSWDEMVTLSAWDDGRCVGHAGIFLVDTTVPGGRRVPSAAVTRVGVLPSHRRRGVATRLMTGLIEEAVSRGLVLASLRASEAVIYGRYGYGVAGDFTEATIDPIRARPVRGATTAGSFRFLAPDEIHATIRDIYDRHGHNRPGVITRPPSFWERYFRDAVAGTKGTHVVVHLDDHGEVDGFVHYNVAWDEREGAHGGKGEVYDVCAADDSIELALWGFVFDLDLVRTWKGDERPVDDIVRFAISDMRAYVTKIVEDEQWIRILDADAALTTRAYNGAAGSVTIAVADPLIAANNATWRITAAGAEQVTETPDLEATIDALSAAYLGGTSWHTLTAAGRVAARDRAAVKVADELFASRPLPFCGSFF